MGMDTEKYLYSVKSTRKMFALCNKLAVWMKENHPEIQWVRDITPEHFNEFCKDNLDHWSNATRREYQSRIHKLGKMVSEVFKIKRDYTSVVIPLKDQRPQNPNPPMTREDFEKLSSTLMNQNTSARFLVDITARIGCRSQEARSIEPSDIHVEGNGSTEQVYLRNCKNGKRRNVLIRKEDVEFFKNLKKYMLDNGWKNACNGITENSCNRAIRKAMRECGISEKYRQSIHAVRKLYAKEQMQIYLKQGLSWSDAWTLVQYLLGHGRSYRRELAVAYLGEEEVNKHIRQRPAPYENTFYKPKKYIRGNKYKIGD